MKPEEQAARMGVLQREMERMERRLAAIEGALMEAQRAAATVEALANAKGEQEILVPLGGGVHARARLDPGAPVLLPVGAGYATEGSPDQVVEALKARVESLAKQYQKANEEAERIAQAAASLDA